MKELNLSAKERLYPSTHSPVLPLLLSLSEHAGTYKHPSYPELTITPGSGDEPSLNVGVAGSLTARMSLKHISGEFFIAEMFLYMCTVEPTAIVRAEFRVDAMGKVARFGVCLDFQDEPDTLIWFDRSK